MSSEADKPGMTLDQLQAAVEHARRSGATGNELVRARLFGRHGGLRSIALDLEEPLLAEPGAKSGKGQSDRRTTQALERGKSDTRKSDQGK